MRGDVGRRRARDSERELSVLGDLLTIEEGHTWRGISISLCGLGRHNLVILNEGQHYATHRHTYRHLGAEVDRLPCLNTPWVSQVLSALFRYHDFISICDEVVVYYGLSLQVLEDSLHLLDLNECLILFNFRGNLQPSRWLSNKLFRFRLATNRNLSAAPYHVSELRTIGCLHKFNFSSHLCCSRSCSWSSPIFSRSAKGLSSSVS